MISTQEAQKRISEEAIRLRGLDYFAENKGKFGMSFGQDENKYYVFWGLDTKSVNRNMETTPSIDESVPWDGVTRLEMDLKTGEIKVIEMY